MNTPRRPARFLAPVAAALAISLSATACNSSPVAATVNGQDIKQTALYSELHSWAGDQAYVSAFDQTNSQQTLPDGLPISVAGQGPGTYNNAWVSNILDNMIAAAAIHQHLTATNSLPDAATIAAARSVLEFGQYGWYTLSASFRDTLTQRLADQAAISTPSVPTATLRQAYDQYQQYFFTGLCTIQAVVQTQADAQADASTGLPVTGAQTCYDQTQFEAQSDAWRKAVLPTAVAKVAPIVPTALGFAVIQIASRTEQGFNQGVQRVLATVLASQSGPDPAIVKLITGAHVHVDPAYGTWQPPNVALPALPNVKA